MGFFSWITCDTKKSIPAAASGREMKPVYLLQPNGLPPIKEECYEGSGVFGGKNAYEWLAEMNAGPLGVDVPGNPRDVFMLGVKLAHGRVLRDTATGSYWHIFDDGSLVVEGQFFAGTYADIIPEFGKSANDLVEEGRMERHSVGDIVGVPYPLKFSFDAATIYENFPASGNCPDQGYFYEDDDAEPDS